MNMQRFVMHSWAAACALIILSAGAFGEDGTPFRPFEKGEYGAGDFAVTARTYSHGNVKVRLTQAKRTGSRPNEPPYACRAWLEVEERENSIWRRYFDDISPAGFSYGLVVPQKKPSPKYLAVVKNGDFDGRLYLIDRDGAVFDLPGGFYFVSADGRYLFSEYAAETQEVVVFDLVTGKIVLDTKSDESCHLPGDIYDWYYDGKRYFFTIVKKEVNGKGMVVEDRRTLFEVKLTRPGIEKVPADFSGLFHKRWDFDPRIFKDCSSDPGNLKEGNAGADH